MIRIRDIRHPWHWHVYDQPARYTFADISQNTNVSGQAHWDRIQWVRDRLGTSRPMNNVKIYGSDDEDTWSDSRRRASHRFWRDVFGGVAAARFHRPPIGLGLNEHARRHIRAARDVTDAIDLVATAPRNDLLADRDPNEAYLLANPGEEYAIYFPDGGSVELAIDQPGAFDCRWYDISTPGWEASRSRSGERSLRLTAPSDGQWVVLLQRENNPHR